MPATNRTLESEGKLDAGKSMGRVKKETLAKPKGDYTLLT